MNNLVRCQNGHLFTKRISGTICPFCGIDTETEEKEDIKRRITKDGEIKPLEPAEKVCGWLVCIEGIRAGMSYVIRSGKNFIGRGDDMDIQILGDTDINLSGHAVIVHDVKKKTFTLLPGNSSGIVYLENEAIFAPTILSSYDKLELGKSLFLFVEFVGNKFSWEEGKGNKEKE